MKGIVMAEINNKNVIEQSRTEVHNEDVDQLEDFRRNSVNRKDFMEHCKSNNVNFKATSEKLDRLMPLAELIQPLTDIVTAQKAMGIVGQKVFKGIMYATGIITFIYLVIRFWKDLINIK